MKVNYKPQVWEEEANMGDHCSLTLMGINIDKAVAGIPGTSFWMERPFMS